MRTHKNRPLNILILVVLLVLILINSKTMSNPVRAGFADTISVPLAAGNAFAKSFSNILPWRCLAEENRILLRENELLSRKIEEAKLLIGENERLKDLLAFRKTIPYTTIPADVIGRDPTNWSNSIIIDKGSASGVRADKSVLSTRGLVGRVLELGRSSAKILLITDPNSKVGVVVQRNGQGGILVGRPDGKCKMIYIALDSDVRPGDKVLTAGFGTIYPKGILVGDVIAVEREPGRLYKCAVVRTSQDMTKLEEVLCVK